MGVYLLACLLLVFCLLYSALWLSPSPDNPNKPPVHKPSIPFIGHVLRIMSEGSNLYISSLCASQHSPMATMNVLGQDMHLIHPLDRESIKKFTRMQHLSLMEVFQVAVGPAMGLRPASENFLRDPDSGIFKRELSKVFNDQLRTLNKLQGRSADMVRTVDEHWNETIPYQSKKPVEVGLGSWVFDMLSHSMGSVFWGYKGPFEDAIFRKNLRLFIQNLEGLRNPLAFLVSRELISSREYVRNALDKAVEDDAYEADSQDPTLFRRLALLYEALEVPREAYTDCHLVAIVGLMSNVINMLTWAFCHIIADQELMDSLVAELNNLAHVENSTVHDAQAKLELIIDNDQVRERCPLLLATWYEMLRIYGDSPVARSVHEDSLFGQYQLRKGSIIMTPIHLHNFSQDVWGPDAESARPTRFLEDGRLNKDLTKHLEVFGLPGMHQCPGRYLGMNITLALLAKALLAFDIAAAKGEGFGRGIVPKRKETMLGLPAINGDPQILISRRQGVHSVQVECGNIKPGW